MESRKPRVKSQISDYALKHSAAHVLASAVQALYPQVELAIGPPLDEGFYYDFGNINVSADDLPKIEQKMREIINKNTPFTEKEVDRKTAEQLFKGQPFKLEMLGALKGKITIAQHGTFTDLCEGNHIENTKDLKAIKLTKVAGAYWRGDSKNPMLTRIYGVAFDSKEKLDHYLHVQEEAAKRDHKVLGPQLELFMFHQTAPGMPYWLPKGVIIYNQLIDFWRQEHSKADYQEIVSPLLNKKDLYITSGHFEHYWDDMFTIKTKEGEEYGVKAMNCPNAMVVFGSKMRSYHELPLRLSDTDSLHRHELSGTLNGLFRVREFRQDDAHIFVTEDQIVSEYQEVFKLIKRFYSVFGIPYSFRLGTRPESFMGDKETWDNAEATLKKILEQSGVEYTIAEGDGAFYGPKVDIIMKDVLQRDWQMGTVQLDFQQPKRFKLYYVGADGTRKTPIAIHRVIYGSMERFIGILIEHFAGKFPTWLSPVQIKLLSVNDRNVSFMKTVAQEMREKGLRVEIDDRGETIGKKVRDAQLEKVPYMITIGDKEQENKTLAIRTRKGQVQFGVKIADFIAKILDEVHEKRLPDDLT
jgi:threonyl-tRNA synthetase